jgi:hypothetical protein
MQVPAAKINAADKRAALPIRERQSCFMMYLLE